MRLALLMLAILAVGCVVPRPLSPSKAYWQKNLGEGGSGQVKGTFNMDKTQPPLVLTPAMIQDQCILTTTNGSIRVASGAELQPQAAWLALWTARSLEHVRPLTGLQLSNEICLYLVHLPGERRSIQFTLPIADTGQAFPWFVPVTDTVNATNTPPASPTLRQMGLKDTPLTLFLLAHELHEWRLVNPRSMLVLMDIQGAWGPMSWDIRYHTRWFRDGFANYAGYHAVQYLRDQAQPWETASGPVAWRRLELRPFSKLAKVKTDLFRWNQSSPVAWDADYYEAALGLFLLIERRLGSEAIPSVVAALPSVARPDGSRLRKLFLAKTGRDLRRLVDDFWFPDLGLTLKSNATDQPEIESVRPHSPAGELDLQPGDVIQAVNNQPVRDLLEYECRLFRVCEDRAPLTLTLLREGCVETREFPSTFQGGRD